MIVSAHPADRFECLDFVHLMKHLSLIVTDCGGLQEETPTLVVSARSEGPEAIAAGADFLVGTARRRIVSEAMRLLDDPSQYPRMQYAINPYGDGHTAERTVNEIRDFFGLTNTRPAPFGSDGRWQCAAEANQAAGGPT